MIGDVKIGVITGFLSKTRDRFHEYSEEKTLQQRLEMVSKMKDIHGVELVFPYEVNDAEVLKRLIARYDLHIAAINVNVKAEPEFRNGGLSSETEEVRSKAIEFIKKAKDFAKEVGANKVTCCPLADGYEFNFQTDYARAWRNLVDSLSQAGSYLTDIPLYIEYKPSETRGRCFVSTAAKALCLLNDIAMDQMGITIDFGHSMYANENPAEVVTMIVESRFPFYVHINDNDARWDWDYMVGTKHLLDYVEFLYYLQEYEYDDYLASDTSPTRWDIKGTFEMNARVTKKLWNLLYKLDKKEFDKLIVAGDYLKTWEFIEGEIFSL